MNRIKNNNYNDTCLCYYQYKRLFSRISAILTIVFLLCSGFSIAQIPQIDCYCIYYIKDGGIYRFNPAVTISASNPSLISISLPTNASGLTISENLNGGTFSPTFYTVVPDNTYTNLYYYYYDGNTWVNTGHKTGSSAAVNIGAGGGYIYNLAGATGMVYRYDGKQDGTYLTQVENFLGERPFDLIADCMGNWYILNSTGAFATPCLKKYDSSGKLLRTWVVDNPQNIPGTYGFAIIGNNIYFDSKKSTGLAHGTIGATTVTIAPDMIGTFNCSEDDMACCAAAIGITPAISIALSCDYPIPGTSVTCTATPYSGGTSPIYQWKVNGVNVGSNKPTYNYTPTIGDKITCDLTSNEQCTSNATVVSNTIVVKSTNPVNLLLNKAPFICGNQDSVLLHVNGADSYIWSNGSQTDSAYFAKTGNYSVTGTVNGGCTGTLSFTVGNYKKPDYKINYAITNCDNHAYQFTAQEANGNNSNDTFYWNFGDKTTSSLQQPTHNFPASGTYAIQLTITNTNGCDSTVTERVNVPAPPKLSINHAALFCAGSSVVIHAKGAKSYVWNDASTLDSLFINQTGMYSFTGTSAEGCTNTYTFRASNYPQPDYSIVSKLTDCNKRQYQFAANLNSGQDSGDSLSWNFGDNGKSNTQTVDHTFPAANNYNVSLTATNANNCSSVYNKTIAVEAPPALTLDNQPKFCRETPMLVTVTGASDYKWSDGSTTDHLSITQEGTYSVTGYSPAGCFTTSTFDAAYFNLYNYQILTDKEEISPDRPLLNMESNNVPSSSYFWNFGDGQAADGRSQSHTYSISQSGYFDLALNVINPYGCTEKASKRIWIVNDANINSFTPNGDGKNDLFMAGWHIQVYNRDGVLLYDGTGGWDGKYKGKMVAKDTYLYVVYYENGAGTKSKPGYVMVLR